LAKELAAEKNLVSERLIADGPGVTRSMSGKGREKTSTGRN